ncbi:MAG: hypothetical protein OJF47_000598 [Nitrospira sp.]|jgi:hypothetical protein|nr:MAG: hypothetical protein OJF47_000598 [Nitrospira sp.]
MAPVSVTASRLPRTWLPAVFFSLVFSLLCAAALYSLLAEQDRSLIAQRHTAAVTAAGQNARAMARTLSWFSESLTGENFAAFQEAIDRHARQAGLLDAAVVTDDNVIVAAANPAAIGRRLQDPAWIVARGNPSGTVTPALEQGRQMLVVVEPLRREDHVMGWIRLVVAAPQNTVAPRSSEDLVRDVAMAIVPMFLLLATLLILTLQGIMRQVRSVIRRILMEAMDQPKEPAGRSAEVLNVG